MQHVKAVIFDWAGTMVDHGSLAPMGAFVEVFAQFRVEVTIDEARGPMGMPKRAHIAACWPHPDIAARWQSAHGRAADRRRYRRVYEVFVPLNTSAWSPTTPT